MVFENQRDQVRASITGNRLAQAKTRLITLITAVDNRIAGLSPVDPDRPRWELTRIELQHAMRHLDSAINNEQIITVRDLQKDRILRCIDTGLEVI